MEFSEIIEEILRHEGGWVNHPKDPGGETNFGITKKFYPHLDIRALKREDAIEIYRADYWTRFKIDELPAALQLMVLDCAVNQGGPFAIGSLQAILGVKVDGLNGPKTIAAAKEADPAQTLEKFISRRYDRYVSQKNWAAFGGGWIKRLAQVSLKSGVNRKWA